MNQIDELDQIEMTLDVTPNGVPLEANSVYGRINGSQEMDL